MVYVCVWMEEYKVCGNKVFAGTVLVVSDRCCFLLYEIFIYSLEHSMSSSSLETFGLTRIG